MKKILITNYIYSATAFSLIYIMGYAFHAFVSRWFGPSVYAELSVILSMLFAVFKIIPVIASSIARMVISARCQDINMTDVFRFSKWVGVITALFLCLVFLLSIVYFSSLLNINTSNIILPVGLILLIWGLTTVPYGLLVSVEGFKVISSAEVIEVAVRFVLALVLIYYGFRIAGALWGIAVGSFVMYIILLVKSREISIVAKTKNCNTADMVNIKSILLNAIFISLPIGFFIELDTILIKRYFIAHDAGIYSASARIGKGLLILSTVASSVIFPRLVMEKASKHGIKIFLFSTAITISIFITGFVFLTVAGEPFILFLFGSQYIEAAELTPVYVFSLIPLAIHIQLMSYISAIGKIREGLWLWLLLGIYLLVLEYYSVTVNLYLLIIGIFHTLGLLLTSIIFFRRFFHNEK